MDLKKSSIVVNDLVEELNEENKRLLNELLFANKCLIVLNEFKAFVDIVFNKIKPKLDSNDFKKYQKLCKNVKTILKSNGLRFESKPNTKTDRKLNSLKSPKIENNSNEIETKPQINVISEECLTNGLKIKPKVKPKTTKREPKSKSKPKRPEVGFRTVTNVFPKTPKSPYNNRYFCEFPECGQFFWKMKNLRIHQKTHISGQPIEQLFCSFEGCPYKTSQKRRLSIHELTHSTDLSYVCQSCDKRFPSNAYLTAHWNRVHRVADSPLICGIDGCERQFKTEVSVKVHRNVYHLYNQKYVCTHPNCNFKISNRHTLEAHLKSHSEERPFPCTVEGCERAFKSQSTLKYHIDSIHRTGPRIKCTVDGCDRYLKSELILKSHIRVHHSTDTHPCLWPGCDYIAKHWSRLKEHSLCHKSESDFVCDWPQCGKTFKRKSYLTDHLRIHTNDKRYACHWPGCSYRCTNTGNICKHIQQVHKKV